MGSRALSHAAPVIALTLAALVVRVLGLGRLPLWYDEGISLLMVTYRPFSDWLVDVHPPLHYALLMAASQLSASDTSLRLPSAILGALTIPVVYILGARLFDRAVGLWAAGFLTITWFHVWYSREARMYSLLVLAFTLALWGLVAGVRDGKVSGWIVYVVGGALTAWSHGIGIYYVAILAVVGLTLRPRDGDGWRWRPWIVANIAIALLFAPWVPVAIRNTRTTVAAFWIGSISPEPPVFATIHLFTVVPIPAPGVFLRAQLGVDVNATFGAGLWVAVILGALGLAIAIGHRQGRASLRFLVLTYLAPIGVFTALSLIVRPILIPRVLLPVAVPLVLLLAVGVRAVPWRRGQALAGVLIGLVLMLGTVYGLRYDAGHTEDWREASRYLQEKARPGDALLILASSVLVTRAGQSARVRELEPGEALLRRYDATGRLTSLPRLTPAKMMHACRDEVGSCFNAALRAAAPDGDVWVIRRGGPIHPAIESWLDHGLERGHLEQFRSLIIARSRLRG